MIKTLKRNSLELTLIIRCPGLNPYTIFEYSWFLPDGVKGFLSGPKKPFCREVVFVQNFDLKYK